jgi:CheY-like chemotaxis protein
MRLCRARHKISPAIPIVALTANVMKQEIKEYKALGFTGYWGKPFDMGSLYQKLVEHLL